MITKQRQLSFILFISFLFITTSIMASDYGDAHHPRFGEISIAVPPPANHAHVVSRDYSYCAKSCNMIFILAKTMLDLSVIYSALCQIWAIDDFRTALLDNTCSRVDEVCLNNHDTLTAIGKNTFWTEAILTNTATGVAIVADIVALGLYASGSAVNFSESKAQPALLTSYGASAVGFLSAFGLNVALWAGSCNYTAHIPSAVNWALNQAMRQGASILISDFIGSVPGIIFLCTLCMP